MFVLTLGIHRQTNRACAGAGGRTQRAIASQQREERGERWWCFESDQWEGESESRSVVSDSLRLRGLYSPWNSPGQNTVVSSLSQGIFPIQRLNPGLLHWRQILYQLSHKGSPRILEWVAYPFSSGSSGLRNQTGVSCIAGGFFTN